MDPYDSTSHIFIDIMSMVTSFQQAARTLEEDANKKLKLKIKPTYVPSAWTWTRYKFV